MPPNCDGLELFEGTVFEKGLCGWVKKPKGRMLPSIMTEINSAIGTKSICLLLPIEQYNVILRKAGEESEKRKKPVSIPMLIREVLQVPFPFMEQKDLFEGK